MGILLVALFTLISLIECKKYDIGDKAVVKCINVPINLVYKAAFYDNKSSESIYKLEILYYHVPPIVLHSSTSKKMYKGQVYRPDIIQLQIYVIQPMDITCEITFKNGTKAKSNTEIETTKKVPRFVSKVKSGLINLTSSQTGVFNASSLIRNETDTPVSASSSHHQEIRSNKLRPIQRFNTILYIVVIVIAVLFFVSIVAILYFKFFALFKICKCVFC